jgi:hypothetical protein
MIGIHYCILYNISVYLKFDTFFLASGILSEEKKKGKISIKVKCYNITRYSSPYILKYFIPGLVDLIKTEKWSIGGREILTK